jgi:hypothetical protein
VPRRPRQPSRQTARAGRRAPAAAACGRRRIPLPRCCSRCRPRAGWFLAWPRCTITCAASGQGRSRVRDGDGVGGKSRQDGGAAGAHTPAMAMAYMRRAAPGLVWLPGGVLILLLVFSMGSPAARREWECADASDAACAAALAGPAPAEGMCALERRQWRWTQPHGTVVAEFDLVCGGGRPLGVPNFALPSRLRPRSSAGAPHAQALRRWHARMRPPHGRMRGCNVSVLPAVTKRIGSPFSLPSPFPPSRPPPRRWAMRPRAVQVDVLARQAAASKARSTGADGPGHGSAAQGDGQGRRAPSAAAPALSLPLRRCSMATVRLHLLTLGPPVRARGRCHACWPPASTP